MKVKRVERNPEESVSQYLSVLAQNRDMIGNPIGILWNNLDLIAYFEDDDFKYD